MEWVQHLKIFHQKSEIIVSTLLVYMLLMCSSETLMNMCFPCDILLGSRVL